MHSPGVCERLYDMDELFCTDEEPTIDGDIEVEAKITPQASLLAVQFSCVPSVHLLDIHAPKPVQRHAYRLKLVLCPRRQAAALFFRTLRQFCKKLQLGHRYQLASRANWCSRLLTAS